jgi:ribosomal protein S18 acetylase RimI-like enzyme
MTIEIAGAEVLDELRPIWLALVAHHGSVAPEEGALRTDDEAWARRRALYAEWIGEPDAFVAVARADDGRAVGYAFVTLNAGGSTWTAPERFGYVETLSLLPEARRNGVGTELLRAVWDHVHEVGGTEVRLGVVAANASARAFYERLGFAPFELTMRARERP